jgi:hypothetical protein
MQSKICFEHATCNISSKNCFCLPGVLVEGSKAKCSFASVITLKLTDNTVISLPGIKALVKSHSCSGCYVDGSV